jgi:hypothetical protein
MGKINWTRVLTGGLLAGLVINIVEAVSGSVYMDEMKAALESHGLSMNESALMMVFWVIYGFVWGIAAIWLYASIRPRYGAGPKTAVIAGVAFWFIGYLLPIIGWSSVGLYSGWMLIFWSVIGLAEMIVATLLGAWIYKEPEAAPASK